MRGHFLSGTRRLNGHYQSGRRDAVGYTIQWSGATQWEYYRVLNMDPDPGSFYDAQMSFGCKSIVGYRAGNCDKLPTTTHTAMKIIQTRPYMRFDVTMTKMPPSMEATGAKLWLSIFGLTRPTYATRCDSLGAVRLQSSAGSAEATDTALRTIPRGYGNDFYSIKSPQVAMDYETFTTHILKMKYNYDYSDFYEYSYLPVLGRGARLRKGKTVSFYVMQDYSTQDVAGYANVMTFYPAILMATDQLGSDRTVGTIYDAQDIRAMGYRGPRAIFHSSVEQAMAEEQFEFVINAKPCEAAEYQAHMPNYVAFDAYNNPAPY